MGGGLVSRDQLVDKCDGQPSTFFILREYSWICGGSIPCFEPTLNYLIQMRDVGLIVTLTLNPLMSGRNINHVPCTEDGDCTEWTDGDQIDDILKGIQVCHIPTADGGMITDTDKLVQTVKTFHDMYPEKRVYFHCWAGMGRTSTAMIYYLMTVYGESYAKAKNIVGTSNRQMRLSACQRQFLEFGIVSDADKLMYEPVIRTPSNHRCFMPTIVSDDDC